MQSAVYIKQFQVILTALVLLSQTAQEDATTAWTSACTADPVIQTHYLLEFIGALAIVLYMSSFVRRAYRLLA